MMKQSLLLVGFTFLALGVTPLLAQEAPAGPVPDELRSGFDPEGPPMWMTAEQAAGPGGALDWNRFNEADGFAIASYLETAVRAEAKRGVPDRDALTLGGGEPEEPECPAEWSATFDTGFVPRDSLADLVDNAAVIVAAEVGEGKTGFFGGRPATLLALRSVEVLRGSPDFNLSRPLLSFPEAIVHVGALTFCSKDARYPPLPSPGSRVLLFPYFPPRDLDGSVIEIFESTLIIEEASGGLYIPFQLETDEAVGSAESLEPILSATKALLREER
jgi:hypothetical protein